MKHLGPRGPLAAIPEPFERTSVAPHGPAPSRAEDTNRKVVRWLRAVCREPFVAHAA